MIKTFRFLEHYSSITQTISVTKSASDIGTRQLESKIYKVSALLKELLFTRRRMSVDKKAVKPSNKGKTTGSGDSYASRERKGHEKT